MLLWHLQGLLITVSIDAVCDSLCPTSVDLAGLLKIQLFVCELSLEYFRLIGYLLAITRAYIHCPCKGIHCVLSLLSCCPFRSLLPSALVCIGLEMQLERIVIELHTSYIYVLCMCVCACIFKSIAQSISTSLSLRLELGLELELELFVVCWVNTSLSLIEFYYRTQSKISLVSEATKLMKSTQMLRMPYT